MCDLQDKAKWHLDLNGGLLPVLETPDGNLAYESAVLADFAINLAPQGQGLALYPNEQSAATPEEKQKLCMKTA